MTHSVYDNYDVQVELNDAYPVADLQSNALAVDGVESSRSVVIRSRALYPC